MLAVVVLVLLVVVVVVDHSAFPVALVPNSAPSAGADTPHVVGPESCQEGNRPQTRNPPSDDGRVLVGGSRGTPGTHGPCEGVRVGKEVVVRGVGGGGGGVRRRWWRGRRGGGSAGVGGETGGTSLSKGSLKRRGGPAGVVEEAQGLCNFPAGGSPNVSYYDYNTTMQILRPSPPNVKPSL
ncbi:uncharacterized protein EV422DRAFT_549174 [Fimicolochytrium jonesii]|uniref:uncharacterized protein n=1 Tax=Fimicolochytrium jonesii TaxID=1396493 RepID=UPI0022FEBFD0|nr:uncharacterized protein EV422DRAFT_549174 [Fimicolochytrium jonesii]KAI8815547.1 hypothetical protein EV422DRAFT_549174 [Fimicolochytrium jonesii]